MSNNVQLGEGEGTSRLGLVVLDPAPSLQPQPPKLHR